MVPTRYGYHILRRPGLGEVRERLSDHLLQKVGARLDSTYMDSLATANEIRILDGAPAAMRAAAESPDDSRRSTKALTRPSATSAASYPTKRRPSAVMLPPPTC